MLKVDTLTLVNSLMKRFTQLSIVILFLVMAHTTTKAQLTTIDWGLHNVGAVTEMVNNRGSLHPFALPSYPRLLNAEFPQGSLVEHHDAVAPFYGSISKDRQDTMVTTVSIWAWNSANEFNGYSEAEWDSVWEVSRGDTADIPYYPNYTPHSDQDLVTRYNDYNEASQLATDHTPQYLDVYQRSWSWASQPLDQFVIFNLEVVPTRNNLYDSWVGIFFNPNIGYIEGQSTPIDDYVTYHPEHDMIIAHDAPGNEASEAFTPMGLKILPPERFNEGELDWTFRWDISGGMQVPRDQQRYEQISSGDIQTNQSENQPANAQAILSFGPIDSLVAQDTMNWRYATIYGYTEEEILEKSALIDSLAPGFEVPSPPPSPEVSVTTANKQVTLEWSDLAEQFEDPNRQDDVDTPFEGYRVYKSTQGVNGPWTLLADYDLADNEFGQNTGIQRQYTDTGLLNNINYYYAVTAYSKPDTVLNFPSQATSQRANALEVTPGTAPPEEVGEVTVVPNPYRGDQNYNATDPPWEQPPETRDRWLEQDRRIQFINLPEQCRIRIFTLSGQLVETLEHNSASQGFEDWNLTSSVGQAVSSGVYLFTVKNRESGEIQTGKFVIIK